MTLSIIAIGGAPFSFRLVLVRMSEDRVCGGVDPALTMRSAFGLKENQEHFRDCADCICNAEAEAEARRVTSHDLCDVENMQNTEYCHVEY